MLKCPICGGELAEINNAFVCQARHLFDVASQGYVNLLIHGGSHGDDKPLLSSRRMFLEKGFYGFLREAVSEEICGPSVIDIGCGEGWYTSAFAEKTRECWGIDISKTACAMAAKSHKNARFAVASSYSLPFADSCASACVSIFAPFSADEVARVLAPDGVFIRAVPLENHLFELKAAVYDVPQQNPYESGELPGFEITAFRRAESVMTLRNDELKALFGMTPYFYRTSQSDRTKLETLDELSVTASVGVITYKIDKRTKKPAGV